MRIDERYEDGGGVEEEGGRGREVFLFCDLRGVWR